MASLVAISKKVNILLKNGLTETGNQKTVSISLGNLSISRYDLDKAEAIVTLLEPCLAKTTHQIREVDTNAVVR